MGALQKKKKKTKLPGQPKKPMCAYFIWLNEEGREMIKKECPEASVTDIAKKAAQRWRDMNDGEKKKFEEVNKELKEKYDEEYKAWFATGGEETIKQAKWDNKTTGKAKGANEEKKKSKNPYWEHFGGKDEEGCEGKKMMGGLFYIEELSRKRPRTSIKQNGWSCKLCGVTTHYYNQLEAHLGGNKHCRNLRDKKLTRDSEKFCSICQVMFATEAAWKSHVEFFHDKTDEYFEEAKKPKMEKIKIDKYEYDDDTKSNVGKINGVIIKVEKREIEEDIKPKLEDPSKLKLDMIKVERFEYVEEDTKPRVCDMDIIKVEKCEHFEEDTKPG